MAADHPVCLAYPQEITTRAASVRATSGAGHVPCLTKYVDEFAVLRAVGEAIFGMDATRISIGEAADLSVRGHRTLRDGRRGLVS